MCMFMNVFMSVYMYVKTVYTYVCKVCVYIYIYVMYIRMFRLALIYKQLLLLLIKSMDWFL